VATVLAGAFPAASALLTAGTAIAAKLVIVSGAHFRVIRLGARMCRIEEVSEETSKGPLETSLLVSVREP
jgi:hypothetical protein